MPYTTTLIDCDFYNASERNQQYNASLVDTGALKIGIRTPIKRPPENPSFLNRIALTIYLTIGLFLGFNQLVQAQVSGTVYREFKMNGAADPALSITITDNAGGNSTSIQTRYAEVGLPNVQVTVYDNNEVVIGTTTTSSTGTWTVATGAATGANVLVEFTLPSSLTFLHSGPHGTANTTSVVRVAKNSTNVNFTFGLGSEHAQDNPDMALACFALPNPSNTTGNPGNTEPMVISLKYNFSGPLIAGTNAGSGTKSNYYNDAEYPPIPSGDPTKDNEKVLQRFQQSGTVYGIAYDKRRNRVLTSAWERAYTGIGPSGGGGEAKIYVTTLNTSGDATGTALWLDLESAIGADIAGTDPAITTGLSFTSGGGTTASYFEHNKIGHISLGDLEISADGRTAFVVNLATKQVYQIAINSDGTAGTIQTRTLPNPCASGSFTDPVSPAGTRPYNAALGLGIHPENGRVYATVTCTGPNSTTDLKGYIYSFDPSLASPTFTEELQIPLNFSLSVGDGNGTGTYVTTTNGAWNPLTNDSDITNNYKEHVSLADIVFDVEPGGKIYMLIGGRNRFMDATSGSRITYAQGIWIASTNGTSWTLESNGSVGTRTTANDLTKTQFSVRNGNGVFFNVNGAEGASGTGNLIALPGFTEVAVEGIDNIKSQGNSGTMFLRRDNGSRTRDALLLGALVSGTPPRASVYKANLWGEAEALLEPAPLEVGNYVFNDLNHNGIQDPSDTPIAGVTVSLVEDTNGDGLPNEGVISTTVTDGNGQYFFSHAANGLNYDTKYVIVINKPSDFTTGGPLANLTPTLANVAGDSKDTRDSDGEVLTGNYVKVAFQTGAPGENNHSFDFGFSSCSMSIAVTPSACNTATNQYTATGTVSFTNVPAGTLTLSDGVVSTTLAITASTTSTAYSLSGLTSGTGSHTITATFSSTDCAPVSITYSAPASCFIGLNVTANPGVCQSPANSYSLTGTISLTNAIAGTATLTDGATSTTVTVPSGATSVAYSLTGLTSGTGSHTITISYASKTVSVTYNAPASCTVGLAMTVTPGICQSATNQYSISGTLSLTNALAGTATITDGATSTTVTVPSGATSVAYSLTGLTSGTGSHTVTVSYASKTASLTYTAPVSCSVAPPCLLTLVVTPSLCQSATNQYSISGSVSATNASGSQVITITDGANSTTLTLTGNGPASFTLAGLNSDGVLHTVAVSATNCGLASTTYTAPASCTVAVALTVTPGVCQSATNQYSISGTISLTNAVAGTATITDGANSTTVTVPSGATSVAYSLTGLTSGTNSHTVTVSYGGKTASMTYTAPASCSVGIALDVVEPGPCDIQAGLFNVEGTLFLTNAVNGVATITDGAISTTIAISSANEVVFYTLTGIPAGPQSHTVTASFAGKTAFATYSAPIGCIVSDICSPIFAKVTPGVCSTTTNTYSTTAVVVLNNPVAGTLVVSTQGQSQTFTTTAVASATFTASFTNLTSDGGVHSLTATLPGCPPASTTYAAPASCTVGLAMTVTPGSCQSATNQYSISGTISLTNALAGTATISDGVSTTTVSVSAGATSVAYQLNGLISDATTHTVTVSYASKTASLTYTAPVSCSVAPPCLLTLVVTPGLCQSATNQYSISGSVSATNASGSQVITITDGANSTTLTLTGNGPASFTLAGLNSDGVLHTVAVSATNCGLASTTYTAPASCTVAVALTVTPGVCQSATNQYSISGTISLTNAVAGTATITDGANSTTVTVPSGATSVAYSLTGLTSGTNSHTVTVSYGGKTASMTYTAPASCTIGLAMTVTPGVCQSATNQYSISGTLSLTNAVAGTATITDGVSTTTVSVSAGSTSILYQLNGLTSGTGSHTVTVSYASKTASLTYTAPVSCSVAPPCLLTLVVTPGLCQSATNQYSISGSVSATNASGSQVITITDGANSTTLTLTGNGPASFTLAGLNSDGVLHTVAVSATNCGLASTTYTAPASCTVAVALTVTPGVCQSATNQYSISGTISLTNAVAGTATITDGANSTTVTVPSGATSVAYSLTGLTSGTNSHTVTVSYGGKTASMTYTAPASCTIGLAMTVTPGVCQSATNQYSISGTLSLTNAVAGTATITDGVSTTTVSVSAGSTSILYQLNGLTSGTGSHTVTVSYASKTASLTYTAPVSCSVAPPCLLTLVVTPGLCQSATNQYSISGSVSATNASGSQVITITDGANSTTLTLTGNGPASFTLAGLNSDGVLHTVAASATNCGLASTTYTAPGTCLLPNLSLLKRVDKSVAQAGQLLSYTIVLSNLGNATANNVTVKDSTTTGLTYAPGSASAPVGTTFTQGTPISTWTIPSIEAGQSLSLTFQATADSTGILYNVASIPGDTARVCTSIPVHMCAGDDYAFTLTAPAGRASYQWYKDNQLIQGQTANTLEVTEPGSYSLVVDGAGGSGQCPDFSCCPFIVVEDTLPAFKAVAIPVTCQGNSVKQNGQIVLSEFAPGLTYQYSKGDHFDAATASGRTAIPVNGVIVDTLSNPLQGVYYTVRVYSGSGCYKDLSVLLMPTVCGCPAEVCVPYVITQTKRPKRLGDPIR